MERTAAPCGWLRGTTVLWTEGICNGRAGEVQTYANAAAQNKKSLRQLREDVA
jgi:hypothetical protein